MVDLWADDENERRWQAELEAKRNRQAIAIAAARDFQSWLFDWSDTVSGVAIEKSSALGWDVGIEGPDAVRGAVLLTMYVHTMDSTDFIHAIKEPELASFNQNWRYRECARELVELALSGGRLALQSKLESLFAEGKKNGQWKVLESLRRIADYPGEPGIQSRLLAAREAAQAQPEPEPVEQTSTAIIDPDPKNWTFAVMQKDCLPWFLETAIYASKPRGKDQAFGRLTEELMKLGLAEKIPGTKKWKFHRDAFQLKGVPIPAGCGIVLK